MHWRQRCQLFYQAIPPSDGVAALDRLAVAINGPRAEIALAVSEWLEKLRRERVRNSRERTRGGVIFNLDIAPFVGRYFGKPALHQRLAGRDNLDDSGMAAARSRSTASISDGVSLR